MVFVRKSFVYLCEIFFPLLFPRIIQNRILVVILAIVLVVTILMAITFSVQRHWWICSSLINSNNGLFWVIKTKWSHESFFHADRPWMTLLLFTTVQLKCNECKNIFYSCLHVGQFPFLGWSSPRFVFCRGRWMFICLLVISSTNQNSLGDILPCPVDMSGVMVWDRAWWVSRGASDGLCCLSHISCHQIALLWCPRIKMQRKTGARASDRL